MLPFDLLAEVNVVYNTASVGSPPFQNTFYYEPSTTPSDPVGEITDLMTRFSDIWNTSVDTWLSDDLSSISGVARMRVGGFIYEAADATLSPGQRTGTQGAGGASLRVTLFSQKRVGQRNGAIYVPGINQADYNQGTGVATGTLTAGVEGAITALLTLSSVDLEADWSMVTLHKTTETESGYEGSPVTALSAASRVTFYDSRY